WRLCGIRALRGAQEDSGGSRSEKFAGKGDRARALDWNLRTEQNDCRAANIDAVVLRDEGAGGSANQSRAGIRAGKRKYHPNCAGQPASGISELARQYTRLDNLAAALVGTPYPGVALRGLPAYCSGGRGASEVCEVRIGKPDPGSGCPGYVV